MILLTVENFRLARYFAQYWATHAQISNASSRIEDGMEECLFDADRLHFSMRGFGFPTKRGPR